MKKVYVISKTHLDLGFTDYAENIRLKYLNEFIPNAVKLAAAVNTSANKKFVWTTGTWILKEALEHSDNLERQELKDAIKRGDIAAHALPFTLHTELLDADTLEYGLSLAEEFDKLRGRKTTAAKMTDVPGHTVALVKHLARHGIKLLHIGVNGASALADVPPCFLWKSEEYEVVVIYSGDYGGEFKCDFMDEILYFDHTLDNCGVPSPEKMIDKFEKIKKRYPDYEVTGASMDDFADLIWEKRDRLPVITREIGDTWIHGSASDPYKTAALRVLMALKREWLKDGSMKKGSREYLSFSDSILCIAEHTCGMDTKKYFADYENYLKADFQKARKADCVTIKHPLRGFPINFLTLFSRRFGDYEKGRYSTIEKSWQEQRNYILNALDALDSEHRSQAEQKLLELMPSVAADTKKEFENQTLCFGDYSLEINKFGGVKSLKKSGAVIVHGNDEPIIEYRSYSSSDYDFWFENYTRNKKSTYAWAAGDFLRPLLKYADGKFPVGSFYYYYADSCSPIEKESDYCAVTVSLKCDGALCRELGAPRLIQIKYTLSQKGLNICVNWFDKDASRLTEAIFLHLYPSCKDISLCKIDCEINPYNVVSNGGRNLHAVHSATFDCGEKYRITNYHSALFSAGKGKILEFDNKIQDIAADGISYVLYNNVWGTNFPLWYEDNARFDFDITEI